LLGSGTHVDLKEIVVDRGLARPHVARKVAAAFALLDVDHKKALARFFVPEVGELATIGRRRVGSAAVRAGRQLQLLAWLLQGWHGVLSLNKRPIASTSAADAAAKHAHEKTTAGIVRWIRWRLPAMAALVLSAM
jgi:hypothetical protein